MLNSRPTNSHQKPGAINIFKPAARGGTYNIVDLAELRLKEFQEELARANRDDDENWIEIAKQDIVHAKHELEIARYKLAIETLETAHGVHGKPFRLQALKHISLQLSKYHDVKYLGVCKKDVNILFDQAFPVENSGKFQSIFEESVRALVLCLIIDRDEYSTFYTTEVLPKLRAVIKSYDEYTTESLVSAINAFTCLQFFLWVDADEFAPDVDSDLTLLLKLLENNDDGQVNEAAIAGISLLTFYSSNLNEAIEDTLYRLLELYEYKKVSVQVIIGKAVALMYSLYDFSEQHDSPDKFSNFRFSVPTVDNGQLMHDLNVTTNKLDDENDFRAKNVFNKIKESISFCLVPWNSPDMYPDLYKDHELSIYEKSKALNISEKKGVDHYSWLQDLLYDTWIWIFSSHLPVQLKQSALVSTAFISTTCFSLHTAKENLRKGLSRYEHLSNPAFAKRVMEEEYRDEWVGRIPFAMYFVVESDMYIRMEQDKRKDVVREKELRRNRQDKESLHF